MAAGARSPRSRMAMIGAVTPGAAANMSASAAAITMASKRLRLASAMASARLGATVMRLPNGSSRLATPAVTPPHGVQQQVQAGRRGLTGFAREAGARCHGGGAGYRQGEEELRAFAGQAFKSRYRRRLGDDALGHGQAQSCPLLLAGVGIVAQGEGAEEFFRHPASTPWPVSATVADEASPCRCAFRRGGHRLGRDR